jgi:Ca2+:H+ antiporter
VIGSILSNLLLVLGMCFFAGGTRFSEQGFSVAAAQINSSLLTLSVVALLLPVALYFSVNWPSVDFTPASDDNNHILKVSHGVAIMLLFSKLFSHRLIDVEAEIFPAYGCYMFFQLRTHTDVYEDSDEESTKSLRYGEKRNRRTSSTVSHAPTVLSVATVNSDIESSPADAPAEEGKEEPEISFVVCLALLALVTVLVAVTAEWLVDSISKMSEDTGLNREFVSLIMLSIVSLIFSSSTFSILTMFCLGGKCC